MLCRLRQRMLHIVFKPKTVQQIFTISVADCIKGGVKFFVRFLCNINLCGIGHIGIGCKWLQCRRTDQERSICDDKKKVEQAKKRLADLDVFIALTQKYVDVQELTRTIVNEHIKKIVAFAPGKSSGKRQQKVKIYFNFVDGIEIPMIFEPIITETTYGRRKTA